MKHLEEKGESYIGHMINAQKIAFLLLFMSVGCFIHSLIPSILTDVVSSRLDKLISITKRK